MEAYCWKHRGNIQYCSEKMKTLQNEVQVAASQHINKVFTECPIKLRRKTQNISYYVYQRHYTFIANNKQIVLQLAADTINF